MILPVQLAAVLFDVRPYSIPIRPISVFPEVKLNADFIKSVFDDNYFIISRVKPSIRIINCRVLLDQVERVPTRRVRNGLIRRQTGNSVLVRDVVTAIISNCHLIRYNADSPPLVPLWNVMSTEPTTWINAS